METVKIHAKINLSLKIVGLAANGYHFLDMLVAPVNNIFDTVTVSVRNDKAITCRMTYSEKLSERLEVPDERNTAVKAARLLMETFSFNGFDIEIHKGIPFMAGLGGSSADASGVILAVSKMFGLDINCEEIRKLAMKCGADVQLQMFDGLKRVRGFGEKIEIIENITPLHIIIAKNKGGVSNTDCFPTLDKLNNSTFPDNDDNTALIDNLQKGDVDSAVRLMINDLQPASVLLTPNINDTLEMLRASGAIAATMTGSGSACIGIYKTAKAQNAALKFLHGKLLFVSD